ncbi:thioredoxin domain-containing protein [Novosphingobium flavum]|uniref:Thioredoxin domain-containing protein n=1 Tax=Novosphingobium aerophilum TaxID=2839843 RepID=A0A7X1FAD3_9SPHN|nr:thioredoxin domain-containing protein [Novosphingobium aerophilum]MBC2653337.1 thioredoxin domain-containing protein [Novosphingobium aerophilum]MBC2663591.1 thioredoxin domain-containing protein [Novosphingobium aerophilum]
MRLRLPFSRRPNPGRLVIGLLAAGLVTCGVVADAQTTAARRPAARAAARPTTGTPANPVLVVATPQGSHVIGRSTAPVKLVEYVSYTCPHCAAFEKEGADTVLMMLVRPGKVTVEVRPFLRNIIDVAATLMVNCGPPRRFQGNHAAVMRNQEKWMTQPSEAQVQRWNSGDLPTRLRAVAGDMSLYPLFEARGYTRVELDRCLTNEAMIKAIAAENEAATKAGVQGTPTFLINGELQSAHDWASLRPLLEAATR